MELPTGGEASVECALEACFVAGRFATVWALRLKVSDEFIAGGFNSIGNNPRAWGTVS